MIKIFKFILKIFKIKKEKSLKILNKVKSQ